MANPPVVAARPAARPTRRRVDRLVRGLARDLHAGLRRTDRRLLGAVAIASVAILGAAIQTGLPEAGSAIVAALWIRVGADAVADGHPVHVARPERRGDARR